MPADQSASTSGFFQCSMPRKRRLTVGDAAGTLPPGLGAATAGLLSTFSPSRLMLAAGKRRRNRCNLSA
eukprot:8448045-Prorocentrum_lima.AAC.1